MPKLKNKSSVKKRFKLSATGKILRTQANKNHFLRNRTKSQLRNLRGTVPMLKVDAKRFLKYFLPYSV